MVDSATRVDAPKRVRGWRNPPSRTARVMRRSMTIRFVIMNAYAVGGTIRTTFTTAAELAKRHDVEIVSVVRHRDKPSFPRPKGVRLIGLTDLRTERMERLAGHWGPRARFQTWAAGRRTRLMSSHDFRHPNFNLLTDLNLLRYLLPLRDGVVIGTRPAINLAIAHVVSPSVVRVGQDHMNLRSYNPGLQAQIRAVYPKLDVVSTLTEGDADDYRAHLGWAGANIRVECMPNGVPDLGGRRAALDSKVVVAAGRMGPQKGFDRLLPVWAKVAPQHPDWELRIWGGGKGIGKLRRQAEELGVADSAHVMGFTQKLHEEFASSSLYVMSSRKEGFPMVLLEAMSVGLPVVSYDCPTGPRDIIREGVDGHVVPDGDGDALAAALSGLMEDEERRKAFGAAAVEGAARYDIAAIAGRWERLLDEIEAGKHGRRRTAAGPVLNLLGSRALTLARRRVRGR
jgi:glycosyltransferase involved in cell wall biosynthesis